MNEKQRGGGKVKVAPRTAQPDRPTEERLAKPDQPTRTQAGFFRARRPLERLRDANKLDISSPRINSAMFEAAEKLYGHFYSSGLGGISAQDLSRSVGAGDGGSCQFPRNELAMHHRQKFRQACKLMGWFEAHPLHGAGRLVVDVVCFDVTLKDAAFKHVPGGRTETVVAAGMDRLRTGLFTLAAAWKLF